MIRTTYLSQAFFGALLSLSTLSAQPAAKLGDNAALRYWSAFALMRDATITNEQAGDLQSILDGTIAYTDPGHGDLVERNRGALKTLRRGAALPECDWGVDYELGPGAPVEYVRKAWTLGRLNALYVYQQLANNDRSGAVQTLASGIRFSHDVATGGPLIAALAAKALMGAHLRALNAAARTQPFSASERTMLTDALAKVGPEGLDWHATIHREFAVLTKSEPAIPASLEELYQRTLDEPNRLQEVQRAIGSLPIPDPRRVLDQKRQLDEALRQAHALLH